MGAHCRQPPRTYVATLNQKPLLAMAAPKSTTVKLAGVDCYRIDYVEVAPGMRGKGWGALALVLAAHRGRELGARGLVMGALPERVGWLTRLGARSVPKRAWKAQPGLAALWIVDGSFDILLEP